MTKNLLPVPESAIVMLLACLLWTCQQQSGSSTLQIDQIKCEYQVDPLGIDQLNPRLSWQMKSSGVRGEKQTAYRIIVASSSDKLRKGKPDLWDSGKITSNQSYQVLYEGEPLQSEQQYYWKVMVWNKDDKPSLWSEPALWSMGLLEPAGWKAKWISTAKEDKSPWYRHQFNMDKSPELATIYLASLGYYELYINGHKVGHEVLAPAVSNYMKRSYYQTFDVTQYLIQGENCIAIWMGQGWYSPGLPGVSHHSPVVRAQLEMEMPRQKMTVITDSTWLTHSSDRTLLGTWRWGNYGGELVDARKNKPDWNLIDASTDDWDRTIEVEATNVPCVAQYCPGNSRQNSISPVSVERLDTGKILVDFGTNLTGLMQMQFRNLEPGKKITLYYADMDARDKDFISHQNLMRDGFSCLGQWDEFIPAGGAVEEFSNKFNYHGFRYALIEGLPYLPVKEDIIAIPVGSDLDETGSFSCSNELYNRINKMVVWTYQCLNLGGQTVDCPHRERLGYGDGQTIMDLGCYNFYAPGLYAKWSRNWWDEQREDGSEPFIAPSSGPTGGGPAWGAMCIVVPWKTYLFYADTLLLEQGYPFMKGYIDFLTANCKDGLLKDMFDNKWFNLGDWVPPGRGMEKQNWVDDTSRRLFNDCYRLYLLDIMNQVASILEKTDDARQFQDELARSRQKIHQAYYNPSTGLYANGEQPYLIFPLRTGVTPNELKGAVFEKYIEALLVKDNGHLNSGMIGTQQVVDYLVAVDRNDLADTFVNQTTYPGWGYMLENGATTCTEQWNGYYSQIHSCFPYIGGWFYKGLAGIQVDPENPGFKNIILRPGIVKSVDWVNCSYESPYGKIISNWKMEGDLFEWKVTIPTNSTATLYLPGKEIQEGGKEAVTSENMTFLRNQDKYKVFHLESGEYSFSSKPGQGN